MSEELTTNWPQIRVTPELNETLKRWRALVGERSATGLLCRLLTDVVRIVESDDDVLPVSGTVAEIRKALGKALSLQKTDALVATSVRHELADLRARLVALERAAAEEPYRALRVAEDTPSTPAPPRSKPGPPPKSPPKR